MEKRALSDKRPALSLQTDLGVNPDTNKQEDAIM